MRALSDSVAPWSKRVRGALLVLIAAGCVALYWSAASRHSEEVNFDQETTDQSAYMNDARRMRESGYEFVGGRNRMPVYPFLLSLLHEPGLQELAFFERGKRFNTILSLVLLGLIFAILRARLSPAAALAQIGVIAFTLFLFKAPYVQCELLFYTLVFASFVLMLEILRKPRWPVGLLAGATIGLAHLTKASVLPGLLIFLAVATCRFLISRKPAGLIAVALTAVTFLAVIYPYISTSKRVFGRYFYNVNTSFYMWYDSFEEAQQGTKAHGDRAGWPDMPEEQIPGPMKYFREHTWGQMLDRMTFGLSRLHRQTSGAYGYYKFLLAYAGLAVVALLWNPSWTAGWIRRNAAPAAFAVCYLSSYLILFAWLGKSMNSGHRVSLMIFLPLMFCAALVIERSLGGVRFGPPRLRMSVATAIHILALIVLAVDATFNLTERIVTIYGGA